MRMWTSVRSAGFVKRDGRPKDSETLVSRLVDRSLRPAFASGWTYDTQVGWAVTTLQCAG